MNNDFIYLEYKLNQVVWVILIKFVIIISYQNSVCNVKFDKLTLTLTYIIMSNRFIMAHPTTAGYIYIYIYIYKEE
jgi:hypothetical protein